MTMKHQFFGNVGDLREMKRLGSVLPQPNKVPIRAAEGFGYKFGEASLVFRRVIS